MAEINWNLARVPDIVGNAYQARQAGIADRRQADLQNAYALFSTDPDAGAAAVTALDPEKGLALQDRQIAQANLKRQRQVGTMAASGDLAGARTAAAGDFDLISKIDAMDDRAKANLHRLTELGASVAGGLLNLKTPEERAAQITKLAPNLKAEGFTDAQIAAIPTDDAGIQAGLATSMKVTDILAQRNADRTFQAGRDDQKADSAFKDKQFNHTVANDAAQLGQGQQRLDIARQSEARQGAAAAFAARGRPIPAPIVTGFQENNTAVAKIRAAIAAIEKHPTALGLTRAAGEGINQRVDPNGIDARAAVSDIGSQKIHDRSGANVTASESPRLKPFIPTVTDNDKAALKKLRRMEQEYLSNNAQIEAQYGPESGYQALRSPAPIAAAPAAAPTVLRFDARGNRIK